MTPYRVTISGWSSPLSLATVRRSPSSASICSRIGAIILQGGHHSAQKSTSTGLSPWSTCSSKFSVVSVIIFPLQNTAGTGPGQLIGHFGPTLNQGADLRVDLGEPAPVDGDRFRAGLAHLATRPQAGHERPGVLQRETRRQQRPDLRDQAKIGLVVLPVAVGRAPSRDQPLLLVVAQRAGAHSGPLGQLPDQHRFLLDPWPSTTISVDTDVKVKPGTRAHSGPPPQARRVAQSHLPPRSSGWRPQVVESA